MHQITQTFLRHFLLNMQICKQHLLSTEEQKPEKQNHKSKILIEVKLGSFYTLSNTVIVMTLFKRHNIINGVATRMTFEKKENEKKNYTFLHVPRHFGSFPRITLAL
jgi:hypothetical protein